MGVIGNCSYMAYIDTVANVKWLCMPRFDSSFLFGSLLDSVQGGEFSITPGSAEFTSEQYYLKNTNILITEFKTGSGSIKVTDFAPRFYHFGRYFKPLMLVRKIEPLEGEPTVKVVCSPRGAWGTVVPEIVTGSNHIRYLHLDNQVRLTTNAPLNYICQSKSFVLNQAIYLVLTYGEPLEAPLESTAENFLRETKLYWRQWIKSASIPTLYQDEVIRSALVLKLHQYEDTGSIIASGSTSLSEHDGSGRNWDYRYCWIRDSYYTLNAFNNLGHFEELEKYFQFIQNIVINEERSIQPVYGISGEKVLTERMLPLSGYRGNSPVRVGNSAYLQKQHDVYGQLLTSLLPLYTDKRLNLDLTQQHSNLVMWLLNRIDESMDIPDAGVWEFRNRLQRHCYTYLFHWAGCKAAQKIAVTLSDQGLSEKALLLVNRCEERIEECYNPSLRAYTQAIGVDELDASTLQLINMHYLDPSSDRAKLHLAALEAKLLSPEGLFYRYVNHDDFGKPKSTFLVCSFWYIEALANVGRVDCARAMLDRVLSCANHCGLFSEDADSEFGQWGNFPQTYSHVGIMNAVYRIAAKIDLPIFY